MSRIGKAPVILSQGVSVKQEDKRLVFSGGKGSVFFDLHPLVDVAIDAEKMVFQPKEDTASARSLWGTMRSLAANAVQGVSEGMSRTLDLKGVGFRAAVKESNIEMNLGFSHPVVFPIPEGVTVQCPSQTEIVLTSCDKQLLGQTASNIRRLRPTEPYKGKGISYRGQFIRTKEGKKK